MKNLDKIKQYLLLLLMLLVDVTMILIILGNQMGLTLFAIAIAAYLIVGFLFRKVPEPEDKEFSTKINFVHRCVTYVGYALFVILMAQTWIDKR